MAGKCPLASCLEQDRGALRLHPLSPLAQPAWLPAISLLCGSLSIQSPGEGRSGFPVRASELGLGVYWEWRGESPVPYGKEKGDSGHGAYLGLDLGTAKGQAVRSLNLSNAFLSQAWREDAVIDDSNEGGGG